MITKDDLLAEFGKFEALTGGMFYANQRTPSHKYNYWFLSFGIYDLIVASTDIVDHITAKLILESVPSSLKISCPNLYPIPENKYEFTHVIAVPGEYHGCMKGYSDIDRGSFFLCVPIKRFEFSGNESSSEFRAMNGRLVSILDWRRFAGPKIKIYFDNPKTRSGTQDSVLIGYNSLLLEIENLSGVANGFIELTNYIGAVVEVLSPSHHQYILIRNRKDEELLDLDALIIKLNVFFTN